MSRIFHIATADDWAAAQISGRYTTSTRGRTLADEGFLHASRGDQWEGVRARFYADATEPLVLLVIDTDLLGVPVIEESVPDSEETFPHIYGALDPAAVAQVLPLGPATTSAPAVPRSAIADSNPAAPPSPAPDPAPSGESFSAVFFREMFFNLTLAIVVLLAVVVAARVGVSVDDDWGALVGTVVGFGVGLPVAIALNRRRHRAESRSAGR